MTQKTPVVSITLPTYNRADLLPDILNTILSQDYADFELIVVDDGSTDSTAQVIAEIARQDARVRYLPLPRNMGIGYARQAALEQTRGRYVALADSDDKWMPGKLKAQVEVLDAYPDIDIVFSNFLNIDYVRNITIDGFVDTRSGMDYLKTRRVDDTDDLFIVESGLEPGLLRNNFMATPTIVLRKEVFDKIGGFKVDFKTLQDHEFCWRAAVLGMRFAYLNRFLIERYRYQSSVTARIVEANRRMLESLAVYRAFAEKVRRPDLFIYLRQAEDREWQKLLWYYGQNNQRTKLLRAYVDCLKHGFSPRTFFFFLTGLGGSAVIKLWGSLRFRLSRARAAAS